MSEGSVAVQDASAFLPPGTEAHTGEACQSWAVAGVAPQVVALPRSTAEAAELLRRASRAGIPTASAGAGHWLGARGGRPVDLVISTERMADVTLYEPADMTVTAGAGLTLAALARRTVPQRQLLALDPPGGGTLGGTVATASRGPLSALYGGTREHVLGATVVTGDGRVLELGGRVVKNVAGFDLLKLMVGGWGAFGLLTSVTVRLHALPAVDRSLVFRGERERILEAAQAVARAPYVPAAAELVEKKAGRGPATALVAVRLFGSRATVEAASGRIEDAVGREPDEVVEGTESVAIQSVVRTAGTEGRVVVRLTGAPGHAPITLHRVGDVLDEYAAGAHLVDGVLRIAWAPRDAAAELAELARVARTRHCGLTVLEGPSAWTRRPLTDDPGLQRLLDGLKQQCDPAGILWPGRFRSTAP